MKRICVLVSVIILLGSLTALFAANPRIIGQRVQYADGSVPPPSSLTMQTWFTERPLEIRTMEAYPLQIQFINVPGPPQSTYAIVNLACFATPWNTAGGEHLVMHIIDTLHGNVFVEATIVTTPGSNTITITTPVSIPWQPVVIPPVAINPIPADGATGVAINATLSWDAVTTATSYDVYFGTTLPVTATTNVTLPTWTPPLMFNNTVYSWKVVPKNEAGDAMNSPTWTFTTASIPPPDNAVLVSPANGSTIQPINVALQWSAGALAPTSYRLFLGTDNPPTNLISDLDLGMATTYNQLVDLAYSTTYYWQIVPYNSTIPALNNPVWSFTTTNTENIPLPPANGLVTDVVIIGLQGLLTLNATVVWNPPQLLLPPVGLFYTLSGANFAGMQIVINHNETFVPRRIVYRILPATGWTFVDNPGSWTTSTISFTVAAVKADGDLEIAFPINDAETLPVELSSFTAILTNDYFVRLDWTTQSETGVSGFYIYRSSNDLAHAERINAFIPATNTSNETSYSFVDQEVTPGTWYYWLQNVDMDGDFSFHGPVTAVINNNDNNNGTPIIPLVTGLQKIYPNPFNPQTTIAFGIAKNAMTTISIYNLKGELMRTLVAADKNPGTYRIIWDGTDDKGKPVSSGVYYVKMIAGNKSYINKVALLK